MCSETATQVQGGYKQILAGQAFFFFPSPPCYQIGVSVSVSACHLFAHYLPCRTHGNRVAPSEVIHFQRVTFVGGVVSGDTVGLYMREEAENFHRLGIFGIPPTGRDHKAAQEQSELPWDSSGTLFTVLPYTVRPCGALRGVVKIGTHSSQSPACHSANGC